MLTEVQIEQVILDAMTNANLSRPAGRQIEVAPGADVFGGGSPLDSLGLVALLIDIEDSLRGAGLEITLSDERAVSQRSSPFRTVPALRSYIFSLQAEA